MNQTQLIEQLSAAGVDTEKAISRFMGNQDLFISFIRKLPTYMKFDEMRTYLEQQNEEYFYMAVHNLKGTAGNLGVQSIFECAQAILVEFRTSNFQHSQKLNDLLSEAEAESKQLSKILIEYEQKVED
nr:Hpt domain-containing protein [uncultured Butyricicoccus sp.]